MSDIKGLVSELLQLLVADVDFDKVYASNSSSNNDLLSSHVPRNKLANISKQTLWSRIDSLLFPYMSYNMKVLMVPPEKSSYSSYTTTSSAVPKKQTLLDAFVKANVTSEAAARYSADHLLPTALYESATQELFNQALSDDAVDKSHASSDLFHQDDHSQSKRNQSASNNQYILPGVGIILANMDSAHQSLLLSASPKQYLQNVLSNAKINFRRLSRSRIQARCTIPGLAPIRSRKSGRHARHSHMSSANYSRHPSRSASGLNTPSLDPANPDTSFDFVWESNSIGTKHNWRLRRFGFADSDDEEHYWRPWENTLEMAEQDYIAFKKHDFKSELVTLRVDDIDWEVSTTDSSTTPTDEDTLSTDNSWSTAGTNYHLSLPSINNSNVPSKDFDENDHLTDSRLLSNGIFYDSKQQSRQTSETCQNNNQHHRQKYLGKQIGGKDFYYSPETSSRHMPRDQRQGPEYSSAYLLTSSHFNNQPSYTGNAATNNNNNNYWGSDDHHNHYESLEIDYEDDYSYKQSHPVFQLPVLETRNDEKEWVEEWSDDEDDLFGVCHSVHPGLDKNNHSGSVATITKVQRNRTETSFGNAADDAKSSNDQPAFKHQDYKQLPANATATKTQPVTEPLLQRVCDGDDDDEAAYWDRYDTFV